MASPALVAAALAALAPAGPETPLATVSRISKAYANALRTKDVAWFEKHTAADFVYHARNGGKRDRAQTVGQMKAVLGSGSSFEKVDIKVISARKAEGGLVAVTDTMVIARLKAPDGRNATLESTTREESLWVLQGKTWVSKRVKAIKDATKIDGKTIAG